MKDAPYLFVCIIAAAINYFLLCKFVEWLAKKVHPKRTFKPFYNFEQMWVSVMLYGLWAWIYLFWKG